MSICRAARRLQSIWPEASMAPLTRSKNYLYWVVVELRRLYFKLWGMQIGRGTTISFSAKLDTTNPKGIHIGEYTAVAFGAVILSHDARNSRHTDTWIGDNCLIGGRCI